MKGINIKDRNYELYSVAKNNEVFTLELTKQDLIKYASELQERINKAIEYIKENKIEGIDDDGYSDAWFDYVYVRDLLKILKGDDKE